MEFENVGAHCQQAGCNQKDFLPFRCATCSKSLCLSHRSYVNHNCNGDKMKDMTSMDCPICGKGVKFDKSQDPNTVWNEHYLTMCTQTAPTTQKPIIKCFKPGCNKTLGPSNTFECPKCHQKVCLAHRIPDEHSCVGYIRKEFLERVQQQMTVGNNKHPAHTTKAEKNTAEKFSHGIFATKRSSSPHKNDGHGGGGGETKKKAVPTVASHVPPPPPAARGSGSVDCPFCTLPQASEAELVNHILAFHPDDDSGGGDSSPIPAPPPIVHTAAARPPVPPLPPSHATGSGSGSGPSAGSSALHREVCPLCQARFADAIALVRHFESSHSDRSLQQQQQQHQSGAGGTNHKSGTDCNIS